MTKQELKEISRNMSSEEIIEKYLRPRRRIDNVAIISFEEKKELLAIVLFERDDADKICDDKLHDILYGMLPVNPNKNESLVRLQHAIADEFVLESDRVVRWLNFEDDELLELIGSLVDSSRPSAKKYAQEIYSELWYRDKSTMVSEDTMYSFIRRMIPSTNEKNFREIAEKLLSTLIILQ